MKCSDITAFRGIFEREMNREGFVWRYQTYMHVDFQQYWMLCIWPRVTNQGYSLNMHYSIYLMNEVSLDQLDWIHASGLNNYMQWGFNIKNPRFENLWNTTEDYQFVFDTYCRHVRPVLHSIHNSEDAFRFREAHPPILPPDIIDYEGGKCLIDYLIYLGWEDEIPHILQKMRALYEERIKHDQEHPPKHHQPDISMCSKMKAARLIALADQSYENEMSLMRERIQQNTQMLARVSELESSLMTADHLDIAKQTEESMRNISEQLQKRFSKRDMMIMVNGW